ncbi:MAG TPA: MFS transporter [Solirubrobacteraceae bacterium]|jgi:MFS family permease|nr:MFS transporter [Solirubrobacteraceae bacterium]
MPRTDNAFATLLVARTLSTLGDIMVPIAVAFAVLDTMGGGSLDVGIVLAADVCGLLAFVLVGGVMADRHSPRKSMIGSDVASFVVQGLIAALLVSGAMTIAIFAALLFAKGAASAFFAPASRALLPRIVLPDELQRANGSLAVWTSIAVIVGPLVGGIVVVAAGPAAAIVLDALTFAVSAALLSSMRTAARMTAPASAPGGGVLCELRGGLREVTARRWLAGSILVASATALLAGGPLLTIMPIVADREYGGAGGYAWLLSALGAGALAGGLIARRLKVLRPLLVAHVMLLSFAAAPLILIGPAPLALAVAAFILAGISQELFGVLWNTAVSRAVPPETLGRVSAWDNLGSLGLRPLGQAVGGAMAGVAGVAPVLCLSACVFIVLPAVLLALPEMRAPIAVLEREPTRAARAPATPRALSRSAARASARAAQARNLVFDLGQRDVGELLDRRALSAPDSTRDVGLSRVS